MPSHDSVAPEPAAPSDRRPRVQLALNVSDLGSAVDFYSRLFGTEPAKRRPGYANFAVAEPPLKLVLIESGGAAGTLNHLGVEVGTAEAVEASTRRLAAAGLAVAAEPGAECCYARQDKVWVEDPDGAPWEVYTVLADSDAPHSAPDREGSATATVCGPGACGPGACGTTAQPVA